MRELTIDKITDRPEGEWSDIIGGRPFDRMTVCEFGVAEEVIALIEMGGQFEVGIGECMRPYVKVYEGGDGGQAEAAFWNAVAGHSTGLDENVFERNWGNPVPAGPANDVPPRCGRCHGKDGRILRYPAGNFHGECALKDQEDDERFTA